MVEVISFIEKPHLRGFFYWAKKRELKIFNERPGPETEKYSRFCILVKSIAVIAIANPHLFAIFKLRVSFETRSIKKAEKRNERLLN